MPSKPKKNAGKEIRGWAVVDEYGRICRSLSDSKLCIFNQGETVREYLESKNHVFFGGEPTIKRCRIILD